MLILQCLKDKHTTYLKIFQSTIHSNIADNKHGYGLAKLKMYNRLVEALLALGRFLPQQTSIWIGPAIYHSLLVTLSVRDITQSFDFEHM